MEDKIKGKETFVIYSKSDGLNHKFNTEQEAIDFAKDCFNRGFRGLILEYYQEGAEYNPYFAVQLFTTFYEVISDDPDFPDYFGDEKDARKFGARCKEDGCSEVILNHFEDGEKNPFKTEII